MTETEEYARDLVHAGFHDRDEIVEAVVDQFEDELTEAEAVALVGRLWAARLAEQESWPAETDADRVLAAFDALAAVGIVARPDFTCCNNCGTTEIGAEAEPDSRGFVFFHQQDTASAVSGGGLWLAYGGLNDPTATTAIGQDVVTALTAAGLPVEWDGSADRRIHVTPLTWQLRLT